MNVNLQSQLRKIFFLVVFAAGLSHAGSYDDFFMAVQQDNQKKVSELLARNFDANTKDATGQTGLHLAVSEPSPKVVSALINWSKTDINTLNSKGESALMLAAIKGNHELVLKMIKKGADVNKTGWAPLHYAASAGEVAIIALLLENSAYIDAESPNGSTPLMMAAMYGTATAVNLLLQEGADPEIKNQQGLTALNFAQNGNQPDSVKAIAASIRSKRTRGQW